MAALPPAIPPAAPVQDLPLSPAIGLIGKMKDTLEGRVVGILVDDGSDPAPVAALRKAQVQTLLVTTAADQQAVLWFGPEPSQIAVTAAELIDLGVAEPKQGPAVDVLLRAAVGTAADVELVPHQLDTAPRGGVGAVLRYADSSA